MRIEAMPLVRSRTEDPYFGRERMEVVDAATRLGFEGAVLDVGCAAGVLGETLLKGGSVREVVGVEIATSAAEMARRRLTEVIVGDANQEGVLPDGPFDGAILADVLEHQVDPEALLRRVVARLRPGAGVVISAPNVRHFRVIYALIARNEWTYQDQGICDRTHLRFFTIKSLAKLIETSGLATEFCLATITSRGARLVSILPPASTFLATQFVVGCRVRG